VIQGSASWIRGWRAGYAKAARQAGISPTYLLLSRLCTLLTTWTLAVILLFLAAEVYVRNVTGESIPVVVVSKWTAWHAWDKEREP